MEYKQLYEKALRDVVIKSKECMLKDKMIHEMAKMLNGHDIDEDMCSQYGKRKDCNDFVNEELCIKCIIEYFEKKASEE